MDAKRTKLIIRFIERVFASSHNISSVEMLSESAVRVSWGQTSIRDNTTHAYSNLYAFNDKQREIGTKLNSFPLQVPAGQISTVSPQRTYRVILQQIPDKTKTKTTSVLDILHQEDVIRRVALSNHHEKVLNDAIVGSAFVWNKQETKFLYVAQAKPKTTKSFLEVENEDDYPEAQRLNQLEQDFGERMAGTTKAQIYEYDLTTSTLSRIEIPDETVFPCYPQYVDEAGESIVFAGYKTHPEFKYGILHCFNRAADIFLVERPVRTQLDPKPEKKQDSKSEEKPAKTTPEVSESRILSNDEASFRPIISPDGKKIAYFGTPVRPPHLNYLAMKLITVGGEWPVEEILPIRPENLSNDPDAFMGVCGFYDDLKNFFWLNDSVHFVLTTIQGASLGTFIVNTATKQVARFNVNEMISDVFQTLAYNSTYNALFASHVNMKGPSRLAFLKQLNLSLPTVKEVANSAEWQYLSLTQGSQSIYPALKQSMLDNIEETLLRSGESTGYLWRIPEFTAEAIPVELRELYENNEKLNPLGQAPTERPLVVFIHGGPHGVTRGDFTTQRLYFLSLGYGILAPNYTGSAGFGQNFMEKLLTRIGDIDTKEILDMIDQVIANKLCDPSKIIVMGGSYGGYMTGILATRHAEKFRCGILMNPVVNIAFNLNITDIPEWSTAEGFAINGMNKWNITGEQYKVMFEQSPMSQPNRLPTINFVGAKDRRVPYQQSIAFQAQSTANGTDLKTFVYPEADHSLDDSVATSFDVLLKTILFIETHLLK